MKLNVFQAAFKTLLQIRSGLICYDKEVKEAVLAGLVRNDDTVCMCKEFREMEEGMCHCQLYVKTKDESIQG